MARFILLQLTVRLIADTSLTDTQSEAILESASDDIEDGCKAVVEQAIEKACATLALDKGVLSTEVRQ